MIIYPAIDVRGGKVVRLHEGDPTRQITFSDDPSAAAERWINEGASWIHMVNLDGAFAAANQNLRVLEKVASLGTPVQFGGGLRAREDIACAISSGASRVVLGTAAVEQPELVDWTISEYGAERICVGLDARDDKITTRGWSHATELTPRELGLLMVSRGVRHALYTNVNRDGSLQGADVQGTITLGRDTGLAVIASGGVSTVEEIRLLAESGWVAGAVIGMALYKGKLQLRDALNAATAAKTEG